MLRKGPFFPFERVSATLARKPRELENVDELRNTRPIYRRVGAPDEASAIKKAIEEFQITERWKQSRLVAQRRAVSQHTTQRAFLLISSSFDGGDSAISTTYCLS